MATFALIGAPARAQAAPVQTASNIVYSATPTVTGNSFAVAVKATNNLPPSTPAKIDAVPLGYTLGGTFVPIGTFNVTTAAAVDDHITPAPVSITFPAGFTLTAPASGSGVTVSGQTATLAYPTIDGGGNGTVTVSGTFQPGS
jgi:hypothetical protein